ncbi:MAG: PEP-CTERM sorting domain-containing protein [Nostoc sp. LLA-1]|nr:PEP-CTERM sorting domain-containing protein [Cyanocohniella sp. LLY]
MITIAKNSKIANKVAAGVAAFGVLAGVGLATAPAQAQTAGSASIGGVPTFLGDPEDTTIQFGTATLEEAFGVFIGSTVSSPRNLVLGAPVGGAIGGSLYNIPFVENFVEFNTPIGVITGDLLAASNGILRNPAEGTNFQYQGVGELPILFRGPGGQDFATGGLFINASSSGGSRVYGISLDKPEAEVIPVPEPTTILGLGAMAALGISTGLKRKKLLKA